MKPAVRLLPYGPRAVLAEYDNLDQVLGMAAHLRSLGLPGVIDVVPAARTVLVHHDGGDIADLVVVLHERHVAPSATGEPIELPVTYDGADLTVVASACRLSAGEVVDIHSGALYTVAFCGFMPGFAYLIGLDPRLHLPRRNSPRPRVPAGSVAVAAEYTAVYPSASPGGWHLLGHTNAEMWNIDQSRPALLEPGSIVRFVPM